MNTWQSLYPFLSPFCWWLIYITSCPIQSLLIYNLCCAVLSRGEWVALSFSRGSSRPRDRTCVSCVSCIVSRFFTLWAIRDLCYGLAQMETLVKASLTAEAELIPASSGSLYQYTRCVKVLLASIHHDIGMKWAPLILSGLSFPSLFSFFLLRWNSHNIKLTM